MQGCRAVSNIKDYAEKPYAFVGRYLSGRRLPHLVIFFAVVAAVTASVCTQYGVKFLVDTLSLPALNQQVWLGFALLSGLILADNCLWRVASWVANSTFVRVSGDVRRDLFRHLTGHSITFFQNQPSGALTSRITATSNAFYQLEQMVVFNALPPLIATVASIILLMTVSLPMALGLAAVSCIVLSAMFYVAARGKPLHHSYADQAAKVDGEMIDIVSNIQLVKSFGRLATEQRRLKGVVKREMRARERSLFYLERLRIFHAVTTALFTFALLAWVISLWQAGRATPGDVVLVCTLGLTVLSATRDLAVALVDVTQHVARLSEALRTLLQPHAHVVEDTARDLEHGGGAITFENVTFNYPSGRNVFDKLSFDISSGERVGLVGASGGGKSTVLSLLQRLYDVNDGRISIDGQDIAAVTDESLRRAIAVVPQDITLFHRSLRDNIRYGSPGATDREILRAAEAACCADFIDRMPQQLDTIVGDRGTKLSGGQRQRIAIARALLKNSPILLLDEATSALDTHSEELIRQALATLMHGRTVIAIAHRLSTLRSFDRIMVLKDGRILQEGAPGRLQQQDGPYRELVDLELSRFQRVPEAA
jgi:ATP-binding cassette, subfamily B, bacterial